MVAKSKVKIWIKDNPKVYDIWEEEIYRDFFYQDPDEEPHDGI